MNFSFSNFFIVSCLTPGPTLFVSNFPCFSGFSSYFSSYNVHFSFFTFSVFLAIFHVLPCEFLMFLVCQFSHHIPGSTVCVSLFCTFFHVSRHIPDSTMIFSCFSFVSFLDIFKVITLCVSHFPSFSSFSQYSRYYSGHFSSFKFFSASRHIPGPTV